MIKCDHVEDTAHWKSKAKLKRLKILYEGGDEARGIRELGGMIASDFTPCFSKEIIDNLMDAPRYVTVERPEHIYVSIDPNGGGPSKMAILSGYYVGKRFVITGMDSQTVRGHIEQKNLVLKHIRRLRMHEYFQESEIWVIPENNLGLEASHIEKFVSKEPNVFTYHENDEERAGVRKSHDNTSDYQIQAEDLMMKGLIQFDQYLFTVSKAYGEETGEHCIKIINELRAQLERYHWEVQEAKDAFGNARTAMTGKMGGAQDDLYIAFAMSIYWGEVHKSESRIKKARGIKRSYAMALGGD